MDDPFTISIEQTHPRLKVFLFVFILLLVYYYEHTVEEASIAMGISANAAYQRLSRAKKLLKDVLTKEGQL